MEYRKMNDSIIHKKILSGLLGKAIGGTLGAPFEGSEKVRDLDFYDPVPEGMVPNDDLDLQIMYLVKLNEMENVKIDRFVLAEIYVMVSYLPILVVMIMVFHMV